MRRKMMVVLGLAAVLAGCGMFTTHTDAVESAAGQQLPAQRLSDLMTAIRGPVTYDVKLGNFITTLWTDVTLFSQALAENKLTPDSALVSQAMFIPITNVTASRWLDTVIARRTKISDADVEAAYKADQVRAVQHILVQVDSLAPKEDKDKALKKAQDLLAQIKGGANFGVVAIANTDDPGSRADSGWYGLKPLNIWDKPFAEALKNLKPGEVSGLVKGHFGYHIIRRPSDDESRKIWRDSLTRAVADTAAKSYYDDIAKQYEVKVDAGAAAHIRQALDDVQGNENSSTVLVNYKGGSLTMGRLAHWVNAYVSSDPAQGPQQLAGLKGSPDSMLTNFARMLGTNEVVLLEASKNNVHLTAAEWKEMVQGFSAQVDSIKATLGLTDAVLDPKASVSDRKKAAAEKVDQYFNDLVAMKAPPKPLPGSLAAVLRDRYKPTFNSVALQRAVDMAKTKHAADSAKAAGTPNAMPGGDTGVVKPAAGGPPVGGAQPPARP
ncbi:MAG TPA: peptidylprolyl isomerase [Gemmatimonadales bacterium]